MAVSAPSERRLGALAAAALVFLADQASKYWALYGLGIEGRPPQPLTPFLDLVLAWNKGVSYSFLRADGPAGQWALIGLASVGVGALTWLLWKSDRNLNALAYGMMIGGALGNAWDRLNHGAVVDFLHLHTTWPVGPLANYVFNFADVGICVGVGLLIYDAIFG